VPSIPLVLWGTLFGGARAGPPTSVPVDPDRHSISHPFVPPRFAKRMQCPLPPPNSRVNALSSPHEHYRRRPCPAPTLSCGFGAGGPRGSRGAVCRRCRCVSRAQESIVNLQSRHCSSLISREIRGASVVPRCFLTQGAGRAGQSQLAHRIDRRSVDLAQFCTMRCRMPDACNVYYLCKPQSRICHLQSSHASSFLP
jgi:hypothetical protein